MKVFVVVVIQLVALVTLTSAGRVEDALGGAGASLGGAGAALGGAAGDMANAFKDGGDPMEIAGKMVMALLDKLDKNKDGSVTADEWGLSSSIKGSLSSLFPWKNISIVADADCNEKLNAKELGSFISLVDDGDGFISEEALGDDETWKTLLANHDTDKDKKISTEEYMAYKSLEENQKCAGCSLTAAVSMVGLVLMAKILF